MPSAWEWLQRQLPQLADVASGSTHNRLRFILQDDFGARAGKDSVEWSNLLGEVDSGKRLRLGGAAWEAIARICSLLAALPAEWFLSTHLCWLLPNVLVLGQLSLSGLSRVGMKLEQRRAIMAVFDLSSTLICANPVEVMAILARPHASLSPLRPHAAWMHAPYSPLKRIPISFGVGRLVFAEPACSAIRLCSWCVHAGMRIHQPRHHRVRCL